MTVTCPVCTCHGLPDQRMTYHDALGAWVCPKCGHRIAKDIIWREMRR